MTLLELMIAVALLGLLTALVGAAFHARDPISNERESRAATLWLQALELRRPVTSWVVTDTLLTQVTVLPDGRIISRAEPHSYFLGEPCDSTDAEARCWK